MDPALAQLAHTVRFEWGAAGAAAVADGVDVAVVVDVLHATTDVTHGLDAGAPVWPVDPADPAGRLALDLAARVTTVVAGSLHNARAVADWLAREHDEDDQTVAVIAAGAAWPDGSLRPAVEDLWGAGAILAALEDHDWRGLSPRRPGRPTPTASSSAGRSRTSWPAPADSSAWRPVSATGYIEPPTSMAPARCRCWGRKDSSRPREAGRLWAGRCGEGPGGSGTCPDGAPPRPPRHGVGRAAGSRERSGVACHGGRTSRRATKDTPCPSP